MVVAHEALPARFDRYVMTAGYNGDHQPAPVRLDSLEWPTEYRYPDRTYRDRLDLDVGGVTGRAPPRPRARPTTTPGRGSPTRRVLCCGDLFIWASPNAGNPQKVQRYPLEWADALRRMLALYDAPGGRARGAAPRARLPGRRRATGSARPSTTPPTLLESLVRQTLALMNGGARLDEVIHTVQPPAGPDRAALPPTGLRRARVHRAHRLAPLRRLVGRQPGHPASPHPSVRWPASSPSWPAGPGVLADRALALLDGASGADAR